MAPPFLTSALDALCDIFIPRERLGGPQSRLDAVKRSPILLPGIKHRPSIPEFVAISTQLSRLQGNMVDPN
jgi:hypothetical protein